MHRSVKYILVSLCSLFGASVALGQQGIGGQSGAQAKPPKTVLERDLNSILRAEADPKMVPQIFRELEEYAVEDGSREDSSYEDQMFALGIIASVRSDLVDFSQLKSILLKIESDPSMPPSLKLRRLVRGYIAIGRFGTLEGTEFLLQRTRQNFWGDREIKARITAPFPTTDYFSQRLQAISSINIRGGDSEAQVLEELKLDPAFSNDPMGLKYIDVALNAAGERKESLSRLVEAYQASKKGNHTQKTANSLVASTPVSQPSAATSQLTEPKNPVPNAMNATESKAKRIWLWSACAVAAVLMILVVVRRRA